MEKTVYDPKTVKIDCNVHRELKTYMAKNEYKSISEAIENLLRWWNWWAGNKK